MAKIRYYTDEHVSRAVIVGLRQRGVDVLSVPEANKLGASDEAHLTFTFAEKRVLFTHDADFLRLASSGIEHAGMVYAPQPTPVGEIIRGLMLIYQVLDSEDLINRIEYL